MILALRSTLVRCTPLRSPLPSESLLAALLPIVSFSPIGVEALLPARTAFGPTAASAGFGGIIFGAATRGSTDCESAAFLPGSLAPTALSFTAGAPLYFLSMTTRLLAHASQNPV